MGSITRKTVILFGKEEYFDENIMWFYVDTPYYAFGYEEYFEDILATMARRLNNPNPEIVKQ